MARRGGVTIEGLEVVERAFKALGPRVAKNVIRKAERKLAKMIAAAIEERVPRRTGKLASTIKVRSTRGTRSFKRQVAIAVLVGQAGGKAGPDGGEAGKVAFYAYMQEHGFHIGKRIRKGKEVIGYKAHEGRLGSRGVRFIPGKRFAKRGLRAVEPGGLQRLMLEIAAGIDREAKMLSGPKPK